MKKRLHELIEMAERGEKFTASSPVCKTWYSQNFFNRDQNWSTGWVTAEWTVRMKRAPRVIYHTVCHLTGKLSNFRYDDEKSASKIGNPIKFIEVIEDEKVE